MEKVRSFDWDLVLGGKNASTTGGQWNDGGVRVSREMRVIRKATTRDRDSSRNVTGNKKTINDPLLNRNFTPHLHTWKRINQVKIELSLYLFLKSVVLHEIIIPSIIHISNLSYLTVTYCCLH